MPSLICAPLLYFFDENQLKMKGFWKPGEPFFESADAGDEIYEDVGSILPQCSIEVPGKQKPEDIIYKYEPEILYLLEKNQILLVLGDTSTGKSTGIPKILYNAGWTSNGNLIGCTQPSKIAALAIATKVAEDLHVALGLEVGYSIGISEKTDVALTQIKYITDWVLFREIMKDPLLSKYNVLMIDEIHQGFLATELVLSTIKRIVAVRSDLRVIISTATISHYESLIKYLTSSSHIKCSCLHVEGRLFPIDIHYLQSPCINYVNESVETILKIHKDLINKPGDILVFLTGIDEIEDVSELLESYNNDERLKILRLFGGVSVEEQVACMRPNNSGQRKVILSTNIAETSLTIDGLVAVIDCGFEKLKFYSASSNSYNLSIVPISKSSAIQRAGRVGRTCAGIVYRLYTEKSYQSMPDNQLSEIQRSNISTTLILLMSLGIRNLDSIDFYSKISLDNLSNALKELYMLKLIDTNGTLIHPHAATIAELSLDLPLAYMLTTSLDMGCTQEILTIVSCLSVGTVINISHTVKHDNTNKTSFLVEEGDLITYLNVYNAFEKANRSKKWCRSYNLNYNVLENAYKLRISLMKSIEKYSPSSFPCTDTMKIRKCVLSSYFMNVATLNPDGTYSPLNSKTTKYSIHPSSFLFRRSPEAVSFITVLETTCKYMRHVSVIDLEWLLEVAPHIYKKEQLARNV